MMGLVKRKGEERERTTDSESLFVQAQRKDYMKMQQRQLSATYGDRTIPRQ